MNFNSQYIAGFALVKSRTYNQEQAGSAALERISEALAWVHDRIFAAGGSHIPATWDSFREQLGISAICNLDEAQPAHFAGEPPASFLWLDISQESAADLSAMHLVGDFIQECVTAGQRVLLHSSQGRHRTRWAFVAFQICIGSSVRSALRLAAEPPWLAPYSTDRARWHQFADHIETLTKG